MEYKTNPFENFNSGWALVNAGTKDKFNSMTISWGSMGTIWHKNIITIYVRPERYTFSFLEKEEYFTVSFFDEKYKDNELIIMGRKSGRDIDKVKECGFHPVFLEKGITYQEAKETFVLKKIYMQQMDKSAFPEEALRFYGENGFPHYMIIGEVVEKI